MKYPDKIWVKMDPFDDGSNDMDFSSKEHGKEYILADTLPTTQAPEVPKLDVWGLINEFAWKMMGTTKIEEARALIEATVAVIEPHLTHRQPVSGVPSVGEEDFVLRTTWRKP